MYWTFLFDIKNNQIEYTECYQVVNYIQNKKKNSLKGLELLNKVKYAKAEKEKFWSYIMDYPYEDVHNEEKLPVVEENDKIQYVFLVDCSEPNDIVNLIYYCILEDELNNVGNTNQKSILCIKANNNGKRFANIKDLLGYLMDDGKINECYFELDKEYQKIKRVNPRIVKQFSPIFYIDESKNSVTYWRQSIDTFLREQYKVNRIVDKENKYIYGETYFLPHICPKKLKKSDDDTDAFAHKYNLLNTFVESFCGNEHKQYNSADVVKLRYEIWKSEEFFKMVRDMPLLAMYIFCISNYFSEYKECDNQLNNIMENLRSEIFNARDMADGVLQIIENIYHSEKKRGFFCFRVHSNSEGRSKKYLQEHYKYYMNKHALENEVTDYLEVKVVDYSHCTITDQFYSNFIKRKEIAADEDRLIYEKIQKDASNIKLASFFETNSFWQKYNSISENMVHHYGLQVFDSLVECYDGYFRVRSQKNYEMVSENDVYCSLPSPTGGDFPKIGIPGTQYDVIIPFKKQKIMQNSAVNVNICYTDYLSKEYEVCKDVDFSADTCRKVTNEVSKNYSTLSYQVKKEKVIYELEEELAKQLKGKVADDRIIRLSAKDLPASMVEIFCKTIVLYIAKNKQKTCYFMITDCTQSHFVEITRILASFYDKQGKNSLMKNNQILLSGEKEGEEFLIVGETLGKVVGSAEKLVFSRSINPECLRILKNMLKNREQGKSSNRMVSIVPFDMVEYDENKPTLFERDLKKVLNTEVQSKEFGCKLENLHVRIGSKIHIRTFYEAELLFHNNYYTSRFAYWLRGEILRNPQLDCKKKITLVGYENYSEMLLSELCDMLKKQGIDIEYIIYEQKATEKFRAGRPLGEYRDSQFVIIIPINSTMTTHIKVVGFLEKTIRREIQKTKDSKYLEYTLPQTEYYGIVLISDKEKKENNYWTRDKKRNTIISGIDNKKMTYYVEVEAEWLHPLKCGGCFPNEDYTKEVPLVETNKESVIPMQAIGIKKKFDKSVLNFSMESEEEKKRLKELSRLLLFDHIERNGNHFNYYFCTEKLWDMPDIQEGVKNWLEQKQNIFTVDKCKVYDIIVAPLHFSNTVFVEIVNRILFGNAALVLHFDVDKEFRMNVKTKYSSLQQLYDNLCEDDEKSIINFHYVDDTIVSGRTFHRTKSLISSLVTENAKSHTEVNLFKSVVLLLNRLSTASIKEYIEDSELFLTYFNLNISSMRVNADACILCKKHNEWNLLAEQASLNEVYLYWKNKSRNVECKPIEKLRKEKREITSEKQYRAELSMIASHKAKKCWINYVTVVTTKI